MKCIVREKIKGGYRVSVSAFLPASESHYCRDNPLRVGDVIDASLTCTEDENIILSRKKFVDDVASVLLSTLKRGDLLDGEVVTKCDFGLFVNVGPFDILAHKNDHCSKIFDNEVGDLVKIKVLDIRDKKVSGKILNRILSAGERDDS